MDNYPDFVQNLIVDIEKNKLKLPTQPEAAVRIRECYDEKNVTPAKLGRVISQDPALAARIIQIANSPLMRGVVPIKSLPLVISRLGLRFVADTATGFAMEHIFQATNDTIDQMLHDVWSSSTYVAAYAHVIAKHFSVIPPGTASLAGLMHQIGILPILSYAQDHDELLENDELLMGVIKDFHPKIGEVILKSWQFPEEIVTLPTKIYQPDLERKVPNLVDVLQVALHKTQEENQTFIAISESYEEAYKRLNLSPEKLARDAFKKDLENSLRFYCQF